MEIFLSDDCFQKNRFLALFWVIKGFCFVLLQAFLAQPPENWAT